MLPPPWITWRISWSCVSRSGDAVERGPALSPALTERVAVAALLRLKHERALPLERGRPAQHRLGNGIAAPGVHVRTPRRELGEARERPERDGDQQDGQDRDRPSPPALLALAGEEGQQQKRDDDDHRPDQERRRLERRRQQREQRVEPQEEVVRLRHGLDDRRIGSAGRPERSRSTRAHAATASSTTAGEEQVLPDRVRHERRAVRPRSARDTRRM